MFDYEIINILVPAVEKSFKKLFAVYNENFYYCSLIMAEDAVPYISAWSEEALKHFLIQKYKTEDKINENELMYRWSYADSPYCAYGFEEYFEDVKKLFKRRFGGIVADDGYKEEITRWIDSMEKAMQILDEKGTFGKGQYRYNMLINAEIMPPENSNYKRALRLNSLETVNKYHEYFEDECIEEKDYYSVWNPELCDVTLIQPVTDKKLIVKLRKCFYYDNDLKSLFEGCANPPFVLKKGAVYNMIIETIKHNPEFSGLVEIKKISNKKK